MAVIEENVSKSFGIRVITGTSASGAKQYKSVNLPPANPEAEPTNSQIYAVASAIAPLLLGTFDLVTKNYKTTLKNYE